MSDEQQTPREPTEEELRQALEEQIRRLRPADVMVQTTVTLLTLAARRLGLEGGEDEKDLGQAREAIEGARALMPLLPDDIGKQLQEPLSHLQMAYAQETGAQPSQSAKQPSSQEPAVKIWTPGS
jgi:hypothetical protein